MWCLKEDQGRYVYILPGCEISFGKTISKIKIEGDASISRRHAVISVEPSEESELQYKCFVYDMSKYGTYILRDGEEKRVPKDEKFILKPDDKVRFGLKHSIFTVTHHSFVVLTSSLKKEEMDKLSSIMKKLGGTLPDNWNVSCTHLTMPNQFLFTRKLTCALAAANIIVTIEYWEAVMKAVEESKKLPKFQDFLPTMNEEWLHASKELFLPKEERKTLFRSLFFVHFCAKQYHSYTSVITAAGGKSCVYPTKKPLTPRDLMANNAVIIQQPTNDSSQFTVQAIATDYPIIHRKLSALNRRMISDSEIPLAILYHSTEKYCNPKFNFSAFFKSSTQAFFSSDLTIVEDTQDKSSTSNKETSKNKQQRIIPETLDSQSDSGISKNVRHYPESKEVDISGNSKSENNICISSSKSTTELTSKQHQIIPETCDSLHKSITSSSVSQNTKNLRVIPESSDKISVDNFATHSSCGAGNERRDVLQEEVEIQQQREVIVEKANNSTLQDRDLMFEKNNLCEENNTTLKKHNLSLKRKSLVFEKNDLSEKDNSTSQNDSSESESWQSSKKPRIVSIEKINNSSNGNIVDQMTQKDLPKINEASGSQLKQQEEIVEVEIIDVNKEDKKKEETQRKMAAKEARIEKRDDNEMKPRKIGTDWHKNYSNCEIKNEILRKDVSCGKTFVKALFRAPTRKLGLNDFV